MAQWVLYAARMADKLKINLESVIRVIDCETGFLNIQSEIVKDGKREESFGIVQISRPHWGKTISKEMMLDPYFSISFLAQQISMGKIHYWKGWDEKRKKCSWALET